MAAHKAHETGTTCPNCQTYFAHVEIEYDGDQGYAALEVTPCAVPECGALLCKCCSQVHTACCGQLICAEHAIAVTSTAPNGSACIDQFCPTCYATMLTEEAEALATAPRCPECLGVELVCVPYDFGTDPDTGYRESGERFECRACGATGEAAEVLTHEMPAAKPMGRETQPQEIRKTA